MLEQHLENSLHFQKWKLVFGLYNLKTANEGLYG